MNNFDIGHYDNIAAMLLGLDNIRKVKEEKGAAIWFGKGASIWYRSFDIVEEEVAAIWFRRFDIGEGSLDMALHLCRKNKSDIM